MSRRIVYLDQKKWSSYKILFFFERCYPLWMPFRQDWTTYMKQRDGTIASKRKKDGVKTPEDAEKSTIVKRSATIC
jgi:hypothetical protein